MMHRVSEIAPFEAWHNRELEDSNGVSIKGRSINLNTASDAKELVAMIKSQRPLLYLELEGNTLGVEAAKEIGKALENKPELVAALWKDLFTGRMKTEIPKALEFLLAGVDLAGARLTCLDLSDNAIGPVGMPGLVPFFKSRNSYSLKELIFNNNGWGPEGGTMLAEALLDCYRQSVEQGGEIFQLRTFICGRSRIENKAAIALSKFFKEVKSLETLHMPQNGIYTEGIDALSDSLKENPNLKNLNLSDNTITPSGCIKLAECLKSLVHVQDLNLGDCLIKTEGVQTLSQALNRCRNLEKVNLESNEIDDDGGIQLANLLCKLPKLIEVNLTSNEFSSRTVEDVGSLFGSQVTVLIDAEEGDEAEWKTGEESAIGEGLDESTSSATEDADAKAFVNNPTVQNFDKLQTDAASRLTSYLDQQVNPSKPTAVACVSLAFTVAGFVSKSATECAIALLEKALADRFFGTYLVWRLGLMKLDEGLSSVDSKEIQPSAIKMLCDFIRTHRLSNAVLATLLFFLRRHTSTCLDSLPQVKPLMDVVDKKLYD